MIPLAAAVLTVYTTGAAAGQPAKDWALLFNGRDAYVEVQKSPVLEPAKAITVECWIKPYSVPGPCVRIVRKADSMRAGYLLTFRHKGGDGVQWQLCQGDRRTLKTTIAWGHRSAADYLGGWHHVAGCYDSALGQATLYIDGQLAGRAKTPTGLPHTGHLTIGGDRWSEGFHGLIDEVRISDVIRYRRPFQARHRFTPDKNTLALYHFDEGLGQVARDSGPHQLHGTLKGAAWRDVLGRSGAPPKPAPGAPPLHVQMRDRRALDAWKATLGCVSLKQHGAAEQHLAKLRRLKPGDQHRAHAEAYCHLCQGELDLAMRKLAVPLRKLDLENVGYNAGVAALVLGRHDKGRKPGLRLEATTRRIPKGQRRTQAGIELAKKAYEKTIGPKLDAIDNKYVGPIQSNKTALTAKRRDLRRLSAELQDMRDSLRRAEYRLERAIERLDARRQTKYTSRIASLNQAIPAKSQQIGQVGSEIRSLERKLKDLTTKYQAATFAVVSTMSRFDVKQAGAHVP